MNEVNINVTRKKKTGFLGTYSIVFHDSVKTLSKMNLKPNAYKIVMYLFGIIEMGNNLNSNLCTMGVPKILIKRE